MAGGTVKQIARWTALVALFLVPLAPLIVINSFFFPFITGKAFYFRILIEIAFCAWAVLAIVDKQYRPRFSWIGAAVLAFVVWMFVADCFAVNVAKAFWSNFERMEGWVLLIHLLAFFIAAGAVLRVEKQWRNWFFASVAVSVIVVIHCFFQLLGWSPIHQGANRIDASFGNSAYLAIYLLFSATIACWLALTEKRAWLKWSLVVLAVIEALLIFNTETRGTILGLAGGIGIAALLAAITWSGRARRYAVGTIIAMLVLVGGFLLIKDTSFVRNNDILNRLASISLADGQVRFTLWHMAYEGFLERPIVGWGQEGYNYVFDKFYDPSLYSQEPWFDRAHNAFIDWLVAGGLPAFLLYISLFGTALTMLWRGSNLSRPERIALTAALVGYAIHNLFVFDNLYSYVYFFAILALIDSQVARPIAWFERMPEVSDGSGGVIALTVAGVCAIALIAFVNYPGMADASELITALTPQSGGPAQNLATFEDLASHPSFAGQEIREQIVSFAGTESTDTSISSSLQQQIADFAVQQMALQVQQHPGDARTLLELALAYQYAGDATDSLKAIQAAEVVSPNKEQIYIQEGATLWDMGNTAGAQAAFAKAYALGPEFPDLAAYAAAGDIIIGDKAAARALLLEADGTTTVDSDVLALAYYRTQDFPDLIALWELRTQEPGATADTDFGLAAAYYVAGEKQAAINEVNATIAQYPSYASEGAELITEIESTTTPQ
jgi:O-antigen ligase